MLKKLSLLTLVFSLSFAPHLHAQESRFPDVPEDFIYSPSIQQFKEEGKIEGYSNGEFKPNHRVQRAEYFKILGEALADEGRLFTKEDIENCEYAEGERPFDVEAGSWYEPYTCILQANNIISGNDDGSMSPAHYIEFSEMAKVLAESFDLDTSNINPQDPWETRYKLYFEALEKVAAIPYSIDSASKQPTRAETVEATARLLEEDDTKVTKTADELTNPFPNLQSCVELKETFNQYQYGYHVYPLSMEGNIVIEREEMMMDGDFANESPSPPPTEPVATAGASSENKAASSDDFSETNVQVEGIDEGDIVKTDGEYIYIASPLSNSVRIVKAYPGEEMEEMAEIDLMKEDLSPQELYIDGNKLVVISSRNYYGIMPFDQPIPVEPDGGIGDSAELAPDIQIEENSTTSNEGMPEEPANETTNAEMDESTIEPVEPSLVMPAEPFYPYYSPSTVIFVFDVEDIKEGTGSEAMEERRIDLASNYHTSRLMDGRFVLVANSSPNYWNLTKEMTGADFLPTLQENNGQIEPVVKCGDVQYAPGLQIPNFMTLLSFDITSANNPLNKKVVLANSESVYMSGDHLYTTNTYFDPKMYTDWRWGQDEAKTHVYQFDLTDEDIVFSGRGEVKGTVLNQFSMDEFKNHLRIATTKGDLWNEQDPATNNVYVLDADGLNVVGELEGLAPNERIYSARFVGNRLYMVTFRQVDPLFVIDLETPSHPKVLGKLKIPGFSNYLHPVDDDHILGFGKDTTENKFGVQVDGFKMGMFDVSNPNDPQELFTEVIGDAGTDSELLWNHKALMFDAERKRIGFPIHIIETVGVPTIQCEDFVFDSCPVDQGCMQQCQPSCTQDPLTQVWTCEDDCNGPNSCITPDYERSQTTFSGAMLYSYDMNDGFEEVGRMTHYTPEDILKFGDWWGYDYEKQVQRLLYIGDYLYSVAFGGIKASDLTTEDLEEVKYIELQ